MGASSARTIIIILMMAGIVSVGVIKYMGGFDALTASVKKAADNVKNGGGENQKPAGDFAAVLNKDSVLVSVDEGRTFVPQFRIETSEKVGQADVLSIAFHPKRQGSVIVSSVADGIFKQTSASTTWAPITFPPKQIYSFILDREKPDDRMFASGVVDQNGRVFRTDDGGGNWRAVYAEPGQGTQVTSLSQHIKDPDIILAGTSHGTVVKSTDGGETWRNVGGIIGGMVRDISFDSAKKSVYYLLSFRERMYYSADGGMSWLDWEEEKRKEVEAMMKSAAKLSSSGNQDAAENLQRAAQALAERNQRNRMPNGIVAIKPDPTISGTIYAGTESGLYRSVDYGKYWYELNIIESAKTFPIRSIAVNHKNSAEIVFVAGRSFYKSVDSGSTWSVTPLSNNRDASFVVFDPFDSKRIFVGLSSVL